MVFPRAHCIILVTASVAVFGVSSGWAEMFACRDSNGKVSYTNVVSTGDCKALGKKKQRSGNWRLPARASRRSYDTAIWAAGNRYNVDPFLIKAVIHAESGFDSRAVSKKGAQGLMQLMPATSRELSVRDPFNPEQNINGGTRYLRRMLDAFDGNLLLSIAAYNAGPGAVRRAGGVPRYPETLRYVVKVLKHYKGYRQEEKS